MCDQAEMKRAVLLFLFRLTAGLAVDLRLEDSSTTGHIPQTKRFELNVTWGLWAPDGVERQQTLINGQFPGPPLIMDEGDDVEVTVNNFMPYSTTIHYHGIEQLGTPWSDGVPGVSQRLIPPGERFVYSFKVQQYGTYWPKRNAENLVSMITNDTIEHAHIYNAIKSPSLVMLSDWFHMTSETLRNISVDADIDALCTDSILVNGKGRVNCRDPGYLTEMVPASVKPVLQGMNYTAKGAVPPSLFDECTATDAKEEIINVDPLNGWASLNFIGSASVSALTVSINNHSLWVYEVDGLYIKPTKVDALTISNGGRYSCLIRLDKAPGNYSITVANSGFNQKIAGFASLSYSNGDPSVTSAPSINYGGISTSTDIILFDEARIEMLTPSQPKGSPDQTYILTAGRIRKAWEWSLNGNNSYGLALEAMNPFLWNPQSAVNSSLVIATKNNTWVDIIFSMSGNISVLQPSHPLHKHSNRVYVLGSGTGTFEWTSVAEASKDIPESFNLISPPMRDTFVTPPAYKGQSWLAIRYHDSQSWTV
ncbi:Multicopper oxidase type 2 protein [Rutstroemia sp. NJR-2017a BVV2]|nr:Multicopper oxidase type 2 protein [Rutstroemia sp. NJR-2017a BVV2]